MSRVEPGLVTVLIELDRGLRTLGISFANRSAVRRQGCLTDSPIRTPTSSG
jgi:hypothetical protein